MISQLSATYHFGAKHTADTTDGKVTNRALLSTESENVHRIGLPACAVVEDEACSIVANLFYSFI